MAGMSILRRARVDDAAEIARLAGELGYAVDVTTMRERLTALLAHPDHHLRVVESGNYLAGWLAAEHRRTLESGERVDIVGLVVDARQRGGGVGRMLVADAKQWTRGLGFDAICVRSNVLREGSHPFCERLGYRRCKTQHVYTKPL